MNSIMKKTFMIFLVALGALGLQACEDGTMENAGEELDNAGDEISDQADEIGDQIDQNL